MRCPAPNACPRSRWSRTIVESSFCAGTRPSHVSGCFEAGVAVAAGLRCLAEVSEQVLPAAADRLAQREHRVEVLPQPHLVRPVAGALVDEPALLHDVAEAVRHPHDGGLAVTARATGLLVVALDRLRQVDVRDEPHVGLVDPHAEGDRRDHHDPVVAEEPRLIRRAHLGRKSRVIRQRVDPLARRGTRRSARRSCG